MSARTLVTGGGGFVGPHLIAHLRDRGETVIAPSNRDVDLRDDSATRALIAEVRPGSVYHLAALASVGRSWDDPGTTLFDNQRMTLSLLEAMRTDAPEASVLLASSGEVYGPPADLPVTEAAALRPQNPYAVSKAACDLIAGLYGDAHGLSIVTTRAFNHAGPGQTDTYLIGSLTKQVADAEREGRTQVTIRTGNPHSRRDFTDVRDVVRAYGQLTALEPGVYNVASGRTAGAADVIAHLRTMTELEIEHEVDESRVRAHDVPEIRGSAEKLAAACGWAPEIPFEQTVRDALDAWRSRRS